MSVETRDRRVGEPTRWLSRWTPVGSSNEATLDEVVGRLIVDRDQLPRFVLLLLLSVVVATSDPITQPG